MSLTATTTNLGVPLIGCLSHQSLIWVVANNENNILVGVVMLLNPSRQEHTSYHFKTKTLLSKLLDTNSFAENLNSVTKPVTRGQYEPARPSSGTGLMREIQAAITETEFRNYQVSKF